jgi:dTDP-4-amino-4,6-dideoxygalactose transaminase
VINDDALVQKARYLINFGIENAESIPDLGTNAKMNEFEAAMGLCMLDEMDQILKKRKELYLYYYEALKEYVTIPTHNENASYNYSYFPVIFENETETLKIQRALNEQGIYPRRYFYPSLDTLNYIEPKQYMEQSRDISSRILCLPLYPELDRDVQDKIVEVIFEVIK